MESKLQGTGIFYLMYYLLGKDHILKILVIHAVQEIREI
jgi:hypothetical protein